MRRNDPDPAKKSDGDLQEIKFLQGNRSRLATDGSKKKCEKLERRRVWRGFGKRDRI
jgi:hypothetical protein